MVPLLAELRTDARTGDERGAARRTLRLEVQTSTAEDTAKTRIHNLSEKGLLIETTADLAVGETIQVDLPNTGVTAAIVIWTNGSFFGCEFKLPVSKAAVSAALLQSPAEWSGPPGALTYTPDISYLSDYKGQAERLSAQVSTTSKIGAIISLTMLLAAVSLFIYSLLFLQIS